MTAVVTLDAGWWVERWCASGGGGVYGCGVSICWYLMMAFPKIALTGLRCHVLRHLPWQTDYGLKVFVGLIVKCNYLDVSGTKTVTASRIWLACDA